MKIHFRLLFFLCIFLISIKNMSPSCRPVIKLGFAKVHKSASTSVQNILFRYALKHDLKVVLPAKAFKFSTTFPFQSFSLLNPNASFDIFALHAMWNHREISSLLGPTAKFVTILREPSDRFISNWDYHNLGKIIQVDMDTFLEQSSENKTQFLTKFPTIQHYFKDSMLYDLGVTSETRIHDRILELEKQFDLVMLADRFDESLVLLKRILCWNTEDITYLPLNARGLHPLKIQNSASRKAYLKTWLRGDYALYDHFRNRLRIQLDFYFPNKRLLSTELTKLRRANDRIVRRCVANVVQESQRLRESHFRQYRSRLIGYNMTKVDGCKFYGFSEIAFIRHLRDIQNNRSVEIRKSSSKL